MRLSLRPANLAEYVALRANLVPRPAAEAWAGLAVSGVLSAAARTGVLARLARGPATAAQVAADLGLDPDPTALLLGCLHAAGYVRGHRGRYRLARRQRRWLDPGSRLGVGHFVAATGDYFDWWRDLGDVIRTGNPVGHHEVPPDDPYWQRYMLGQRDLARLSATEVAAKLDLARPPRTILDIGGGHGLYSAALCRRHPGATATVLDLPGAVEAGRATVPAAVRDRISHVAGDARSAELPGGQDLVLCFNLIHHLTEEEIRDLLMRIHAALAPDGTLAVLDAFAEPGRRGDEGAAYLGMFLYLASGSRVFSPRQLAGWLVAAGFAAPRAVPVRRVPGLALYRSRRLPDC